MCGHGSQLISNKINIRHPGQLKKSKSWEPFWSYQLNSTANFANLAQFWGKWAGLPVLFSWKLQNGPKDFDFFNCHGCQTFILYEIHCYQSPPKSWHNNSFLGSVSTTITKYLFSFSFHWEKKFPIGQAIKRWPIKLSFSQL